MLPTPVCADSTNPLDPSLYMLTLADQGNDGWNGVEINILTSNNTLVLSSTLASGSMSKQWVCLVTDCYRVVISDSDSEISWELEDRLSVSTSGTAPSDSIICTSQFYFNNTPTTQPTVSLKPSQTPSTSPYPMPIPVPSTVPTLLPTPLPSFSPSSRPSIRPTPVPTPLPTVPFPTQIPSPSPTELCSSGTYWFEQQCLSCEAGKFTTFTTAPFPTSCSTCVSGKYSNIGASECINCDEGKYSTSDRSECAACQSGQYVNRTLNECVNCPSGRYAPVALDHICNGCVAGSETRVDIGASECSPCSPGSYSLGDGVLNTCSDCPVGSYSITRASSCIGCEKGTYADTVGSDSCVACDAGKSTVGIGNATTCADCGLGYYSTTRSSECSKCPEGTYVDTPGSPTCVACAAGQYGDVQGGSSCSVCAPGKSIGVTGRTECTDCEAGKYSDRVEQNDCYLCEVGHDSIDGASTCDRCVSGYFWAYDRSNCELCPEGAYCVGSLYQPVTKPGYWMDRTAAQNDPSLVREIYQCGRDTCKTSITSDEFHGDHHESRRLDNSKVHVSADCWILANFSSSTCTDAVLCEQGSEGILCGGCQDGWVFNSIIKKCSLCKRATTFNEILVVIGVMICLMGLFHLFRGGTVYVPHCLRRFSKGQTRVRVPIIGVLFHIDIALLKVVWSTMQIIVSVSWTLQVTFPEPYQQLISWLSFLQLDILSIDCIKWPYFWSVYAISTIPMLCFGLCWGVYIVRKFIDVRVIRG
mmetsp:Transcript_43092/g.55360  ORF Transcript_43092/g.55360 Transcript_43092/m.55360 type:complete len:756 (-) Transcript_43092:2863-5130(-)